MSAKVIDGKAVAESIHGQLKVEVDAFAAKYGYRPCLTVVLVGENPASQVYVRNKHLACEKVGMKSEIVKLEADASEQEVLATVERLNNDKDVHGILVQLPLPSHIDEGKVLNLIDPDKDVDGFHPVNVGRLVVGEPSLQPCTPSGVMELIKSTGIELSGKSAVVVGRSNIVGKPVAMMLLKENATVTICHSRTTDIESVIRGADVVVAAVGRPEMITGDMIKDGAVVIDVGINRLDTGKLVGDVAFESASAKASAITPVPGGVGPMTIAMLIKNTMQAARSKAAAS